MNLIRKHSKSTTLTLAMLVAYSVGAYGADWAEGVTYSAGTTVTYNVPALPAGEYYFDCEVHPEMNGSVTAS